MRLRNIPGSREALTMSGYVIDEPESLRGRWNEEFANDNPLRLEIGIGKGRFIIRMAERYPDINFVGIERYSSVLVRVVQKLSGGRHVWEDALQPEDSRPSFVKPGEDTGPANLRLICMDAKDLPEVFDKDEIDGIYLNFSDPWPKDRHAKRRLPGKEFLEIYKKVLKPEGTIEFKTDNRTLFDFALESIPEGKWDRELTCFDLHADEKLMQDNIMTEYEEKFSAKGNPICKYIIRNRV